MNESKRTFVPFEGLWEMVIDVPYSFLVRDGGQGWSCGQLALDKDAKVMAPGDLVTQSAIVADYISQILERGDLTPAHAKRLLLYYVHSTDADRAAMIEVFRDAFGPHVVLDPIPVPYYYYDGVMLEVDIFTGGLMENPETPSAPADFLHLSEDDDMLWLSVNCPPEAFSRTMTKVDHELTQRGLTMSNRLSGQWFAPASGLRSFNETLRQLPDVDPGTVVDMGPDVQGLLGWMVFLKSAPDGVSAARASETSVELTVRHAGAFAWIQARSRDDASGIVEQVKQIMPAIEGRLAELGLDFSAVVKSTTHYVGGNTAAELHDNMAVRNAYYSKPGPASTGLPVFGFADDASKIVVDITAKR